MEENSIEVLQKAKENYKKFLLEIKALQSAHSFFGLFLNTDLLRPAPNESYISELKRHHHQMITGAMTGHPAYLTANGWTRAKREKEATNIMADIQRNADSFFASYSKARGIPSSQIAR